MTGSALGRFSYALVKQSKQVLFPAHCTICALVILGKITQAILAALWAFIVQNTFGGMIHVIKQNNTSFRQGGSEAGGAAAPTPRGGKGGTPPSVQGSEAGAAAPTPQRGQRGRAPIRSGEHQRPRPSAGGRGRQPPDGAKRTWGGTAKKRRVGLWG